MLYYQYRNWMQGRIQNKQKKAQTEELDAGARPE